VRKFKSLQTKFVRTLLLVTMLISAATLAVIVFLSAQTSARHLTSVQRYIEEGITSKGLVIAQNHALALRSLTLDNAFLDMQRLVDRTTNEDSDVVYGIYIGSESQTLAYARAGLRPLANEAPAPDSWKELSLSLPELLVKKAGVRKVIRVGQEVLECSAPVWGEDNELVGTIRYGLSTQRMRDAIARARADARERLIRSVLVIGSLLTLAIVLILLISRAQAVRITRPVTELSLAAGTLASGNRDVRVQIESGDELEQLGASFNRMVEDLDASYRHLEEMNHTLEIKVTERTAELGHRNRDMRLVLDNVDQGFATLSADGTMAVERSRVVSEWFGDSAQPLPFWSYLAPTSADFAVHFQLAWEQITNDILPLDVCLTQLPARLTESGRTWSFRYLPFYAGEKLDGLLVVIAEISERLAKEREEGEQAEAMQVFKRLVQDRAGFTTFFREAGEMVTALTERKLEADPLVLKRTLHTLKGNAGAMDLTIVARISHALEEELENADQISNEGLQDLATHWQRLAAHLASFGGKLAGDTLEVSSDEYSALLAHLGGLEVGAELMRRVQGWRLEPVEKPFQRLADQGQALAKRLERGELKIRIEANGVRLEHERFAPFFFELGHVVRNAVDHGLEPPSERKLLGKPALPCLSFRARATSSEYTFEIGDDGRGIDWDAIARKAAERGLPHEGREALLNALCHDGITTRDEVTGISGRGVGMASLRQHVIALSGRLEVESVRGEGTRWIVRLPRSSAEPGARTRRISGVARGSESPPARELARG
jgi:HAMP domain-containing protein/HPt (histidine-containing phosphotransfer) domain-containing protein